MLNAQHLSNDTSAQLTRFSLLLLCVIGILTIYRGWVLYHMPQFSLHFDEAQYWLWSQHLDWGYYSKPPMLAAVIHFFTHFLGHDAPNIRSISLVFYPLTTLAIFYLSLKLFKSPKIAFWSSLTFITMPGVSLSSLLITTDVVLFLAWILSCLFFWQALQTNAWRYWLALGITAGCGLLTKYTMGIFAVAAMLLLISTQDYRHHLKNPKVWIGALLAGGIFLPNILWNSDAGWPSLRHTVELSSSGVSGLHPLKMLNFLAEQFGVFGLISFAVYAFLLVSQLKRFTSLPNESKFLLCFSLTFLLIITIQALQGRAYANWAAPTYAMASLMVGHFIANRPKLCLAMLITNLLLMTLVYHGDSLMDTIRPNATKGPDPMKTLRDWDHWADNIQQALIDHPECALIVKRRDAAAQALYQLRETPITLYFWNPDQSQNNHYEMNYSLPSAPLSGCFLFLTQKSLPYPIHSSFKTISPLSTFVRQGKYKPIRHYTLYFAEDFKGYR